jgi:N-methylhydantoinase A
MFDLAWKKPEPLAPRRWRREATERMGPHGEVITPLDAASVRRAAEFFVAEGVQAVAVCFLHSYRNSTHEREALAILREAAPGILLTASCDVLPEIKEYERTSTAVVNAYLLPAMRLYLARLSARMQDMGIHAPVQVMASSGGMIGLAAARKTRLRGRLRPGRRRDRRGRDRPRRGGA